MTTRYRCSQCKQDIDADDAVTPNRATDLFHEKLFGKKPELHHRVWRVRGPGRGVIGARTELDFCGPLEPINADEALALERWEALYATKF